ncbi:hypothetical protein BC831DRAFT_415521 [Entophlyctis helioformis]|nr:hypothetical protein BC831DRAFT_415521 [Entophlyctis helioformis]
MNATEIADAARKLTRFGELGGLKLFIGVFQLVTLAICSYYFIRDREQPMIKYRSWSINLWAVFWVVVGNLTDGSLSMDGWVSYSNLRLCIFVRTIAGMLVMPSFLAIFLRHYFLLRLPIVQAELLDHKTMVDPDKYKLIRAKLERVKFLSTEYAAWYFYLPNAVVTTGIVAFLYSRADIDRIAVGYPTPADQTRSWILLAQIVVAAGWFFIYMRTAPKDNFYIKEQFWALTIITIISLGQSAVLNLFKTPIIAPIIGVISACLSVTTILIDIAVPTYLVNRTRYKLTWTPRASTKNRDGSSVGGGSRPSVLARDVGASSSTSETASGVTGGDSQRSSVAAPAHMAPRKTVSLTIPKILADPTMREAFCRYLAREFSMESLLFIEAVKQFRESFSANAAPGARTPENVRAACAKMMAEFVTANSVNEVNLPKKCVDRIKASIESVVDGTIDPDKYGNIFDDGAEHIQAMLALNHLRKFQTSQIYKDMMGIK